MMIVRRGWGIVLMGTELLFGKVKFLEMGGGDGCTTM